MFDTNNSSDEPMSDWSTGSDASSTGSFVLRSPYFDRITLRGPVNTIPKEIPWRTVVLQTMLYVDYREMPLGENIPRNSVAFRVRFMSGIEIGGRRQVGAIIHLEMADSDIYAPGNYSGNRWFHNKRANEDFYPGQLEIQFIRSVPESDSALHTSAFPITTPMTLGALISAAMANQMHKFVFLPRHRVNQLIDWEGTTDFFLQFWALLVRRGEVGLQDTEGHPLANTIGWFYHPNAPPLYIGVPRGIFIEFERIDDVLTQVPVPVMNGR